MLRERIFIRFYLPISPVFTRKKSNVTSLLPVFNINEKTKNQNISMRVCIYIKYIIVVLYTFKPKIRVKYLKYFNRKKKINNVLAHVQ